MNSTRTRRSEPVEAAFAIVRIAFATRPPLPISRPRSSPPTVTSSDEVAVLLDLRHLDGVGILDQRPGEELDQVAHQAPAASMPLVRSRPATVRVGWAPWASQCRARSLVDLDRRRIGLRVVVADRLDRPAVARRRGGRRRRCARSGSCWNPTLVSLIRTAICGRGGYAAPRPARASPRTPSSCCGSGILPLRELRPSACASGRTA